MKKCIVTIVAVMIMHVGFSQANNMVLDSVAAITIHYLQTKQADSIYALAGVDFKNTLTAEKFKAIAEGQVFPLNDFKKVTYINTTNSIKKYKVEGAPELQLLIGLDSENKLQTFLIQPFSNN